MACGGFSDCGFYQFLKVIINKEKELDLPGLRYNLKLIYVRIFKVSYLLM